PQLTVTVTGVPAALRRSRWVAAKVRVRNAGTAAASDVRLTTTGARGVGRSWKARRVGTLAAGQARTTTLRLRLTRRTTRSTLIAVRATGRGGLRASAPLDLRLRGARPTTSDRTGLVGRYFWGFRTRTDRSWDNTGVFFANARYAYRGIPSGGLPRCARAGNGCVRWSLDRRTGRLRVGTQKGTYRKGRLVLGDVRNGLAVPRPGSRFRTALEHRGFEGTCGFVTGCTTWRYTLVLDADGRFLRTSSTIASGGGAGTIAPFAAIAGFPADQTGTYEVLDRGRIRLAYADGTTKTHTVGVETTAKGRADPVRSGLLLDDVNFYPATD
ncbi:hypothetical protein ACVU7I_09290, partial [Patulibacter sp. S7RM1-6]